MASRLPTTTPACLLALLLLLGAAGARCPPACLCSGGDRRVDCSGRNLSALPPGLQDNVTHLNLSHNLLADLDHQLTRFANLRTLDLSHNALQSLPAGLPRSLWEIHAARNGIRVLRKLDTASQWNLRLLDVSGNALERAVLINNTLSSLRALNLSGNKLWTVPTNLPSQVETVDLSHNALAQILPGSLDRLARLATLYLHGNRFTSVPAGAFDALEGLRLLTLFHNPWACGGGKQALAYLDRWLGQTQARVLGAPCLEEEEDAATPWTAAPLPSAAPTAAEKRLLVKATKAKGETGPPATTEPTPPRLSAKEAAPSATAGPTATFTSTGRPLALSPGGLDTEKSRSFEVVAATRAVYLQGASSSSRLGPAGQAGGPTTPMTLSITSGVPTSYSKRPRNATAAGKREEPTTKVSRKGPAKGGGSREAPSALLSAVALAAAYGLVLK